MAAFALTSLVRPKERVDIAEAAATTTLPESAISALVRQVFFSRHGAHRKRMLFASAGPETSIVDFSINAGKALSEISGGVVGFVDSHHVLEPERSELRSLSLVRENFWQERISQLGKNLWAIPSEVLELEPDDRPGPDGDGITLDYVLCAAQVNDNKLPLFCSYCEAAVLVLTANRTHREAALRAKRILQQLNVELLGVALRGREFPIPDFIYRRL